MIKLVISDLDGTLLTSQKLLPEGTFDTIEKLHEKGITFVVATGRQLDNTLRLFEPVKDFIYVIAENGGLVWKNGDIVYTDPTPWSDVHKSLKIVSSCPGLYPVVSCINCAYFVSDDKIFAKKVEGPYSARKKLSSFFQIPSDEVCLKISVWDKMGTAVNGGVVLPPKMDFVRCKVSGPEWLDISVKDANKGKALKELARISCVNRDECL